MMSLALLTTIGCGTSDPVAFDFAANVELATVHPETRIVNLGLPSARLHLLEGWSKDEKWGGNWAFAWGYWPESTLEFYTFEPRSTVIRFRCRPSDAMARAHARVELVVNGHNIATVPLRAGFNDYHVRVPGRRLRAGRNVMRLRYGHGGDDFPQSGDRHRPTATVAWQRIRIGPEFSFGSVRTDGQSLEIPFHTRVDYFIDAPPGATLRWDRIVPWGVASGRSAHTLRVEVLYEDSSAPSSVTTLTGAELVAPFDAALDGHGVARVSFLALPAPGTPEHASGFRILRPTLTAPAETGPPTPSVVEAGADARPAGEALRQTSGKQASLPAGLKAAMRASLSAERPPNVIVYLVDTLRADHLSTYGYARPTSPSLDAMSTESVVFDHAMAQSGWTRSSVASILTGLGPRAHAVLDRDDTLSVEAVTLQQLLKQHGYQTHAVITNGNLSSRFGFDNGFDSFVYFGRQGAGNTVHHLSNKVNEAFFEWLDQRQPDRPFFAYLHAMDPHGPYTPPEPFRSRFVRDAQLAPVLGGVKSLFSRHQRLPDLSMTDVVAGTVDLYDAEIAHNDAQFGLMLDRLRASGIYDSTVILFVSDHGEEFLDHGGSGHGRTLYSEMIFVPLVIKFPGSWAAGTRVNSPVQHIDILPTILDVVGLPPASVSPGDNLVPLIVTAEEGAEDSRFTQRRLLAHLDLDGRRIDSLLTGDHHLMKWYRGVPEVGAAIQMYRWRTDAAELTDLSGRAPVSTGYLRLVLQAMASSQSPLLDSEDAVIDGELARTLRALGYLQ
jgi:arylsulfatase